MNIWQSDQILVTSDSTAPPRLMLAFPELCVHVLIVSGPLASQVVLHQAQASDLRLTAKTKCSASLTVFIETVRIVPHFDAM